MLWPLWRRVLTRVRTDARAVLGPPWTALQRGDWRRWWLGPALALAVLVLAMVARTGPGQSFVQRWAIMRGDEAWWLTLEKVPLSLFAPAYQLPFRFAIMQVFIVFGGAQVLIGVWRTLGIGLAAHVLGTVSVRMWVWLGPPAGLPVEYLRAPDAGPSVATLGIVVYLVIRLRVMWLACVLLAFHIAEWVAVTGLAQREHLIGGMVGALAAAGPALLRRFRAPSTPDRRPDREPFPRGLPAHADVAGFDTTLTPPPTLGKSAVRAGRPFDHADHVLRSRG
jgi:hypothetical protein